ncbi:MAG: sugar transferase [Candidatus Eisenbacteria bacterium]
MGQVERQKRTTWLQFFWVVSDLVAILLGVVLGYVVRFQSPFATWVPPVNAIPPFDIYLLASVAIVVVWVPLFYALGLYRVERGRARHRRGDLTRGFVLGALILAAVGFFYRGASFSRVGMVLTWLLISTLVVLGRTLIYVARRRFSKLTPIRFVVMGEGPLVGRIVESLRQSSYPHECAGVIALGASAVLSAPVPGVRSVGTEAAFPDASALARSGPRRAGDPRVLGTLDELAEIAQREELDLVVMAASGGAAPALDAAYVECQRLDLDFQFVPEIFSVWRRSVGVEDVDGLPLLRLRDLPLTGWNGVVKRALDLVVSIPLLVVLSPVFLVLAIAVKLSSPGPIFHRQVRVGRDRRPFEMVKFRSMRADAEKETGPVWAQANDPRRTRLGTFLRKWSLDELPQIWNVCRGEMSLRAAAWNAQVRREFESSVEDYYDRHRIKSGVTGWAQVHGLRGNVPIEDRTAYDLYYIEIGRSGSTSASSG